MLDIDVWANFWCIAVGGMASLRIQLFSGVFVFILLAPLAWAEDYKPANLSDLSRKGARYFKQLNCLSCHSARGVGGDLGPSLDAVGSRRSQDFLMARMSDSPKEKEKFAEFPGAAACSLGTHPRLSDASARAVTAFLLTLGDYKANPNASPHGGSLPADDQPANLEFKPAFPDKSSEQGRLLYQKHACAACHSVGEVGGWVGPALDGIGGRHSLQYIKEHIRRPSNPVEGEDFPKSRMPSLPLSDDDVGKLAAFLMTLPNPEQTRPASEH